MLGCRWKLQKLAEMGKGRISSKDGSADPFSCWFAGDVGRVVESKVDCAVWILAAGCFALFWLVGLRLKLR